MIGVVGPFLLQIAVLFRRTPEPLERVAGIQALKSEEPGREVEVMVYAFRLILDDLLQPAESGDT